MKPKWINTIDDVCYTVCCGYILNLNENCTNNMQWETDFINHMIMLFTLHTNYFLANEPSFSPIDSMKIGMDIHHMFASGFYNAFLACKLWFFQQFNFIWNLNIHWIDMNGPWNFRNMVDVQMLAEISFILVFCSFQYQGGLRENRIEQMNNRGEFERTDKN